MRKNIVICGLPSSGKSTLLDSVVSRASHSSGFLTREIRPGGRRVGFEMISSAGKRGTIAHVDWFHASALRTGRFGVDPKVIDDIVGVLWNQGDLLYADEVGQIQLTSTNFRHTVICFLDSPNTCVVTLSAVFRCQFIEDLKRRSDVVLVELRRQDRDRCSTYVSKLVGKIDKARRYSSDPSRWIIQGGGAELHSQHGIRSLGCKDGIWSCDCDFYLNYHICSHTLAAEEVRLRK